MDAAPDEDKPPLPAMTAPIAIAALPVADSPPVGVAEYDRVTATKAAPDAVRPPDVGTTAPNVMTAIPLAVSPPDVCGATER